MFGRIVGDHLQSPSLVKLGEPTVQHFLEGNRLLQPITGASGIIFIPFIPAGVCDQQW